MKKNFQRVFNFFLLWIFSLFPFALKPEDRITSKSLKFGMGCFILNLSLSLIGIYSVRFLPHFNPSLIGVVIIQFLIFLVLFALLMVGITFVLHLLSKIFKSQGSFADSLKASCAASTPLSISFLSHGEILQTLAIIYLLMVNFYFVHKYQKIYAILNIGIPSLFYILFLTMVLNY